MNSHWTGRLNARVQAGSTGAVPLCLGPANGSRAVSCTRLRHHHTAPLLSCSMKCSISANPLLCTHRIHSQRQRYCAPMTRDKASSLLLSPLPNCTPPSTAQPHQPCGPPCRRPCNRKGDKRRPTRCSTSAHPRSRTVLVLLQTSNNNSFVRWFMKLL